MRNDELEKMAEQKLKLFSNMTGNTANMIITNTRNGRVDEDNAQVAPPIADKKKIGWNDYPP